MTGRRQMGIRFLDAMTQFTHSSMLLEALEKVGKATDTVQTAPVAWVTQKRLVSSTVTARPRREEATGSQLGDDISSRSGIRMYTYSRRSKEAAELFESSFLFRCSEFQTCLKLLLLPRVPPSRVSLHYRADPDSSVWSCVYIRTLPRRLAVFHTTGSLVSVQW